MKIRNGFVSNSSSASFVIKKDKLSRLQIDMLLKYAKSEDNVDGWSITDNGDELSGWTVMDNGELGEYLEKLYIPVEDFIFEDF